MYAYLEKGKIILPQIVLSIGEKTNHQKVRNLQKKKIILKKFQIILLKQKIMMDFIESIINIKQKGK